MQIRKAARQESKLRIGMNGPSGSGKTYSALLMAYGITRDWSKIVVIDSENWSADLYSHLWEYSVLTLEPPFTPESYIEAINYCETSPEKFEVIIIDSVSHEWDGKGWCLEINEKLASAKFKGNTWAAWSETTPRHQKFIEAITHCLCHVITTSRSKTDTIQTEDKKIKKVGMKEIQREWFEYELTVNFSIDRDNHLALASKDRTSLFIDRDPFLIDQTIGKEIMEWNQSGADPEQLQNERKEREDQERLAKEEKQKAAMMAWKEKLEACKNVDECKIVWSDAFNDQKNLGDQFPLLEGIKNQLKIKFESKAPQAPNNNPPATTEWPKVLKNMQLSNVTQLYKDIEDGVIQAPALADVIAAAKERYTVSEKMQAEIVRRFRK